MAKHVKRKREFSKIMAVIAVGMWVLVNMFGLTIVALTFDTTPLMYVIPSVDAVVAIVLTAYYAKAKVENQIKLKKIYGTCVDTIADDISYINSTCNPLYENSSIV